MAIKLNLSDTHIVLSALQEYREQIVNLPLDLRSDDYAAALMDVDRLIKSYKRSFAALERIGW
jgi:hypothetical protein